MSEKMKISLLQQDIVWAESKANTDKAEAMLLSLPSSDLYVLPEMFSTGFATEPEGIAEDCSVSDEQNGIMVPQSLLWMKKMAVQLDGAIAGSIAVKDGEKYCNRFYFVEPDGKVTSYDKHHLFTYGKEHLRFARGEEKVIVDFRGVRFLLQICYDLRFPVFARNNAENPYDVAIYVASWPTSRIEAWKALLKARAIENQCYVAAVDRVGEDPACSYCGGTMLIDSYGKVQVECEENKECAVTGTIDLDELRAFRKKFPVLGDADGFRLS